MLNNNNKKILSTQQDKQYCMKAYPTHMAAEFIKKKHLANGPVENRKLDFCNFDCGGKEIKRSCFQYKFLSRAHRYLFI